LKTAPKNEGGRPSKTSTQKEPVFSPPVLADIGIDKKESSHAQALADMKDASRGNAVTEGKSELHTT
jgi:hypothetical protein